MISEFVSIKAFFFQLYCLIRVTLLVMPHWLFWSSYIDYWIWIVWKTSCN